MAEQSIQFKNEYISLYNNNIGLGYDKYTSFIKASASAAYAMETRLQNALITNDIIQTYKNCVYTGSYAFYISE
jgi:hypothetical protein